MKKAKELQEKESSYKKSIGNKIKIARANQKCTQEKLAERIDCSTRYISQLERGIAFGSATTIINLCKALNINADFLFQDLINCESSQLNSSIDDKFIESYIQLDDYNREALHRLANELLKMQEENKNKTQK